MSDATKKNGAATAALVLGIVSLALCWIPYLAIPCGIVAIILAVVAKNKIKADPDLASSSGAATGGLITGIIGTLIATILLVLAIMFVSAVANNLDNWENVMDDYEQYQ
ncbi:MAG: hypothetical protein ACI865_002969 [Flavobacteriaceae bacterium]|jgi:predicted PurR-regulated permease PerM